MWTNRAACNFIGGKLTHHRRKVCKTGKPHSWKRVTRCVQGPVLSSKGLNYKTGTAFSRSDFKNRKLGKKHYETISGLKLTKCYKFQAFDHKQDYMSDIKGIAFNSPTEPLHIVFKPVKGLSGTKKSISLTTTDNKNVLTMVGPLMKFMPIKTADKATSSFWVGQGLMHKGVSLMPVTKKGFFLRHEKVEDKKAGHKLRIVKFDRSAAYRGAATWFPVETKCK